MRFRAFCRPKRALAGSGSPLPDLEERRCLEHSDAGQSRREARGSRLARAFPSRWRPIITTLLVASAAVLSQSADTITARSTTEVSPSGQPAASPQAQAVQVGLYDVFETRVVNSKSYSNPFDFNVIELRATFTAPSGKKTSFFGFYDGNGNGGQNGNVWKLRFMPDELGTWSYTYTWTDGTPGGSGSFEVVDTGLPGPLRIARDNSWYFEDQRGEPFHFRGYSTHVLARYTSSRSLPSETDYFKEVMQKYVIDRGYNFTMWDGPMNRLGVSDSNTWRESWWLSRNDTKRFNIPVWHAWEEALDLTKDNGVYVITFAGMIYQGHEYGFNDFRVFLRYWVARFAPYYNYLGWNPTWEWTDIWSASDVDRMMRYIYDIDPWKRLLTAHDCSHSSFTGWLGFSMRQAHSNDVFRGNSRTAGLSQGSCGQRGGVASAFLDMPIIGSEDIWESRYSTLPTNRTEVRRAAWGIMMAGVLPLYSDWTPDPPPSGGKGEGEPEVRRMFDIIYGKTQYRQYRQLNNLVSRSAGQIGSGIPGEEYLVYDQNGGSIDIDLSGASSSTSFKVLWIDPKNGQERDGGSVNGGGTRSLSSPFSGDSVLLLSARAADTTPPSTPASLTASALSQSEIGLTWAPSEDPETGVATYNIYRDGVRIGQSSATSFTDTGLDDGTQYTYEVSAVNGAGLESARSAPATASTLADTTPPTVEAVSAAGDASTVVVRFSEPVAEASAAALSSYSIDNGIVVLSVSLHEDQRTVALTTSSHTEGVTYTLTVSNVLDRATSPNAVAPGTQVTYTYVALLSITNLSASSGKGYRVMEVLTEGATAFIDRSHTISNVPVSLVQQAGYIMTANDDKALTGDSFLTFNVSPRATVCVAHDDRIASKPSWLASFSNAGTGVTIDSQSHSLWCRDYEPGQVTLGANAGVSKSSMYSVVVMRSSAPANLAPEASFSMTPGSGTAPLTVQFDASGSADPDGQMASYLWEFGDGSTGEGQTVSHVYASAGNFTVKLTVTDDAGATDTATATVSVSAPSHAAVIALGSHVIDVGQSVTVNVIVKSLANGLSGLLMDVVLAAEGVAKITGVAMPDYGLTVGTGVTSDTQARLSAVDLTGLLEPGAADAVLASFTAEGISEGSVQVDLVVHTLHDDNGQEVQVQVSSGTIQVMRSSMPTMPGMQAPVRDLDGDGLAEDLNGNGRLDFDDVVTLFQHQQSEAVQQNPGLFDFNGNGRADMDDIVKLFDLVTAAAT